LAIDNARPKDLHLKTLGVKKEGIVHVGDVQDEVLREFLVRLPFGEGADGIGGFCLCEC
jgi:hypothetical protein